MPDARSISLFFKVHDAELAFQPGWPHVQQGQWRRVHRGQRRAHLASKGQLLDTQVSDVYVNIPHVPAGHTHLFLDGGFAGGLGDGLKILKEAPIGTGDLRRLGRRGRSAGQGQAGYPAGKGDCRRSGRLQDCQCAPEIGGAALELSQLKGDFRFDSAKGLRGNITAQAFDKPVSAQIADGKPGTMSTRVSASGQVEVVETH
jgi:uncharacterized protein YhdP